MKEKERQKNKDSNRKFYIIGEICGKIGIAATAVVIISMTLGTACMLAWDIKERKNIKTKTKNND